MREYLVKRLSVFQESASIGVKDKKAIEALHIDEVDEGTSGEASDETWVSLTEGKDPADYAKELLATAGNLRKMLEKSVDILIGDMEKQYEGVKRLDKLGAGGSLASVELIKKRIIPRAKDLQKMTNMIVGELEKTQK